MERRREMAFVVVVVPTKPDPTATEQHRSPVSVDPNDLPRPYGDFTLLRLIAQGGMGAVYLALRPIDDEESQMRHLPEGQEEVCVVKTVRSDLKADREAIGRFLDEARVVQKLTHPRICRTLDAGVIEQIYYLALEFISGRNLRDVHTRAQKRGEALPEALIVHVISDMLEALDYAHHLKDPDDGNPLNIVHRDVSPHNVMLGFDGNTRLIDFGLAAHELKRELTRPGVMVGKLRYNAPEQVRDRALDGRSDVYSAAVVLYEFIANERFYDGLPEEQVWRVAMKGDHRPRSWRDIDIEWRHLLDVALQNDPEKRYRTAKEFRAALLDVAEARGIDVRNTRKDAKAFMAKAFGTEQVQEREMILQATGIAEARTKLFRSPSELQSAIQNIPARPKAPPVEMKTEILDQNALHYQELRDMMSRLAEPDAETQLPADPVQSQDDSALLSEDEDFHVDASVDRGVSKPVGNRTSLSGPREPWPDLPDDASRLDGAATNNDDEDDPSGPDEDDTLDRTNNGRLGRRSADAPPREPVVNTGSMSRRSGPRSRAADPLPPLPPRPAPVRPPGSSPFFALGLGLFVVVALGIAAMFALPRLLKKDTGIAPEQEVAVVDAGIAPLPPVVVDMRDAGFAVLGADAGADAGVLGDGGTATASTTATTVDAGPDGSNETADDGTEDPTEVDDDDNNDPDPKRPPRKPRKPRTPVETVPPKTPAKPATAPKGFGDQVDYLKTYCVGKVRCAASVVRDANRFMQLSPADLRDLKREAGSCVDRCRR